MPDSLFNDVAGLQVCNFIKMSVRGNCFPVSIAKFLRTVFSYKFFSEWLVLFTYRHTCTKKPYWQNGLIIILWIW